MSKKILVYPETRQVFNYDCGANGIDVNAGLRRHRRA